MLGVPVPGAELFPALSAHLHLGSVQRRIRVHPRQILVVVHLRREPRGHDDFPIDQ